MATRFGLKVGKPDIWKKKKNRPSRLWHFRQFLSKNSGLPDFSGRVPWNFPVSPEHGTRKTLGSTNGWGLVGPRTSNLRCKETCPPETDFQEAPWLHRFKSPRCPCWDQGLVRWSRWMEIIIVKIEIFLKINGNMSKLLKLHQPLGCLLGICLAWSFSTNDFS